MKSIDESYKMSTDYELLYNYCIHGYSIVCSVDFKDSFLEKTFRDIAVCDENLRVSARGIGYNDVFSSVKEIRKTQFIEQCNHLK